jgi:hypothetical protein
MVFNVFSKQYNHLIYTTMKTTEKSTWESFTELMEDIYYEGILKEQTQEWIQWHWEEYKNNN